MWTVFRLAQDLAENIEKKPSFDPVSTLKPVATKYCKRGKDLPLSTSKIETSNSNNTKDRDYKLKKMHFQIHFTNWNFHLRWTA